MLTHIPLPIFELAGRAIRGVAHPSARRTKIGACIESELEFFTLDKFPLQAGTLPFASKRRRHAFTSPRNFPMIIIINKDNRYGVGLLFSISLFFQ